MSSQQFNYFNKGSFTAINVYFSFENSVHDDSFIFMSTDKISVTFRICLKNGNRISIKIKELKNKRSYTKMKIKLN